MRLQSADTRTEMVFTLKCLKGVKPDSCYLSGAGSTELLSPSVDLQNKDLFSCRSLSDSSLSHYSSHCAVLHPLVFMSSVLSLTLVLFSLPLSQLNLRLSFSSLPLASPLSPSSQPPSLCATPPPSTPSSGCRAPEGHFSVRDGVGEEGMMQLYAAASPNNGGRMDRWTIRAGT